MVKALLRLFDGRVADLCPDERRRFFSYAYRGTSASRTALTFGMPLLFLIGWVRDYAVNPASAQESFARRALLFATLILLALLSRLRSVGAWREVALVVYACVFSAGIAMTTLAEPARMSLTHVVAVLMTIIILPFALRRVTAIAVVLAFCAPMFVMLQVLQAPPVLWWAYLAFGVVGVGIGLAHRRTWLDTSLDLFLLRKRLLSRLHTDALTEVLNRDGWQARATREHERLLAERRPVSIAYFDLDHFKQINDCHGHAEGDAILRAIAAILRQQTRPGELVARLGGEEFLTLLPGTDEDGAFHYASRIRAAVEAMDGPVTSTLSGGVAEGLPGESLASLMARADAAMLEAKRRGRNLVLRAQRGGATFSAGSSPQR